MFTRLDFLIALRYLRARRREGFISVIAWFSLLGVMLGVATLIIVLSVMNGFRADLLSRVVGINGHVNVLSRYDDRVEDYQALAAMLSKLPEVEIAMPVIERQGLASIDGRSRGVMVRAYDLKDFVRRDRLASGVLTSEALQKFQENQGILIGDRLARSLQLRAFELDEGRELRLLSPDLQSTIFGSVPKVTSLPVTGLFSLGLYEYDDNFIFMALDRAQAFFQFENGVSRIEVIGKDPETADQLAAKISALLPSDMIAIPWQRVNGSLFTALQVERNVMFIILTLIILVAAFNIISSQIMLVKDKARGIAILKSMGADHGLIYRVFLITGSAVGIIGAVLGGGLGILVAANIDAIRHALGALAGVDLFSAEIYFLSTLPSKIDPVEVWMIIAMAIGLSLLASLYPAWRASRLDPVEILRYG